MANFGNIIDLSNANANVERVEGEVMATPIVLKNTFAQATKIKADKQMPLIPSIVPIMPTTTIIVPEDKGIEAKMLLEQLGQDWQTARQTSGMYGMYRDRTILTTHWDWENRRDVTLVGAKVQEGMKDLNIVRKLCDHDWEVEERQAKDDIGILSGYKTIRRSDLVKGKDGRGLLHTANDKYVCVKMETFYQFAQELVNYGFNCRNGVTLVYFAGVTQVDV